MGSFLLGLAGALVGVIGTLSATFATHRLTQRRDREQTRAQAAADFLACVQGIRTEYQMLDLALDLEGVDKVVGVVGRQITSHERGELPKKLFERGLDAWSAYRAAEANLTANSSFDMKTSADDLHKTLDEWVDYVDARFLGSTLDLRSEEKEPEQAPADRYRKFRLELAAFESRVRTAQSLPDVPTSRRIAPESHRHGRVNAEVKGAPPA